MKEKRKICRVCRKNVPKSNGVPGTFCSIECRASVPSKSMCKPKCLDENMSVVRDVFNDGTAHYRRICSICLMGKFVPKSKKNKKASQIGTSETFQALVDRRSRERQELYGDSFYSKREWLELRYLTLMEKGCICCLCGSTKKPMHVDHIKPRSIYPKLALDPNNMQVLCAECNIGKGIL